MKIIHLLLILIVSLLFGCTGNPSGKNDTSKDTVKTVLLDPARFDTTINGKHVKLYVLKNKNNVEVAITNYGARIVSVRVPDRNNNFDNVVLGLPSINDYIGDNTYLGCIVGRYANRLAKGKYKVNGKEYSAPVNNGVNSLHGGLKGFQHVVWNATQTGNTLSLNYSAADGQEGYPGKLDVTVAYSLTDANELKIEYEAVTDKPTVINLSNHAYFNLKGEGEGDILDHELQILADNITPVDSTLIPTGLLMKVEGTPFDFRTAHKIGQLINEDNEQLKFGKGYDHNWVLNKKSNEFGLAAKLVEPETGRVMEIFTTEPGFQFYSGNFMDGTTVGIKGKAYDFRNAVVLETQHFPDSPNHPSFPSTLLKPGDKYYQLSVYKFSTKK